MARKLVPWIALAVVAGTLIVLARGVAPQSEAARPDRLGAREGIAVAPATQAPRSAIDETPPAPRSAPRSAARTALEPAEELVEPAREGLPEPAPVWLRARLLEEGTERPLTGYRLRVSYEHGIRPVVTDAGGAFSLEIPPGFVSIDHEPDPEDEERSLCHPIEPHVVEVGQDTDVVLHARRPTAVIVVDVLEWDGSPAAGARVDGWARYEPVPPTRQSRVGEAFTDSGGRARIGVFDPPPSSASLLAGNDAGDVSELVSAELLPDEPIALQIGPPGELEVLVRDPDGKLVFSGTKVIATGAAELRRSTDYEGRCLFAGLVPGTWRISVFNPTLGWEDETVEVPRGVRTVVEVHMTRGPRELAAAGIVRDERGRPLEGVVVAFRTDVAGIVRTDHRGRFRCFAEPAERAFVGVGLDPVDGEFEPPPGEVPFGRDDLVYQLRSDPELRSLALVVVDAPSGEEIECDVEVVVDLGPGTEDYGDLTWLTDGIFEVPVRTGLRLRVRAPEHLERTLSLADFDALDGDEPLRLELERGFQLFVRALDARAARPLAGAVVSWSETAYALTDASGRAVAVSDRRPPRIEIAHPGYATASVELDRWTELDVDVDLVAVD